MKTNISSSSSHVVLRRMQLVAVCTTSAQVTSWNLTCDLFKKLPINDGARRTVCVTPNQSLLQHAALLFIWAGCSSAPLLPADLEKVTLLPVHSSKVYVQVPNGGAVVGYQYSSLQAKSTKSFSWGSSRNPVGQRSFSIIKLCHKLG